jgi:hypothetical protein
VILLENALWLEAIVTGSELAIVAWPRATALPPTCVRFVEAFEGGVVVTVPETVTALLTVVRKLPDVSSDRGLVWAVV